MENQRNDMQNSSVSALLGTKKISVFNCPYLGTLEDTDTSLAYPAAANHCFRDKSPASIDLSHQEAYCLTDQHPNCHVFLLSKVEQEADEELVVVQTAPKQHKRRLSLFALPIILVLILLAAIIWWPAPGTTIQDSLVRGAQYTNEISGGATLTGKPVAQQPVDTPEETVGSAPEAEAPSSSEAMLDESHQEESADNTSVPSAAPADSNPVTEDQSPLLTDSELTEDALQAAERSSVARGSGESSSSSAQPAAEVSVDMEFNNEETSAANEAQSNSETGSESAASVNETAEAAVEESAAEVVEVEAESSQEAETTEGEESPVLVTADLPVIATDTTDVSTAPAGTTQTNDAGEQVVLVGPVASSALSLEDGSEAVSFLPVYQSAGGGQQLSQIESKQFVTILGLDESAAWVNVRLENGTEGWINANQSGASTEVSAASGQVLPTVTSYPVIRYSFVDTGALNMRSGPGVEYDSLSVLNMGEIVGLIGRRSLGPWVRIRLDSGTEGWVNSSLLAPVS